MLNAGTSEDRPHPVARSLPGDVTGLARAERRRRERLHAATLRQLGVPKNEARQKGKETFARAEHLVSAHRAAVHAALALTKTPFGAPPAPPAGGSLDVDTAQIAQILGYHGKVNGGVYQVGVPRAEQITADGVDVAPSMGLATAINIQPTGGGKTAITGDFVLIASEVNPVIRALRDNGIAITALHSHMLSESPHLYFMHYWANDAALKLAHGLRAALDKMNVRKAG